MGVYLYINLITITYINYSVDATSSALVVEGKHWKVTVAL